MKSAIFSGALVLLVYLLGWFSSPLDWQKASGWNKIPEEIRPVVYKPGQNEPEIYWLGHAGFLIRWENKNILVDPNLSDHTTIVKRHMIVPVRGSDLPSIDALLITHAHFDHLDNPTINSISNVKSIVIPARSESYLNLRGLSKPDVVPMSVGEVFSVGRIKITAVRAIHGGNRFHPFAGRHFAVGYILESDKASLYVSGDTAFGDHLLDIKERFHPAIAILPIGGYSPRIPLKYHHLNPEDAVSAAKLMGIRKVIPAHFGTFRVAFDRPSTALPLFFRLARENNVHWEMPLLLTKDEI